MGTGRGESRQAWVLTLVVWGVTYLLFLVYALIARGRVSPALAAVDLVLVAAGAAITALLYGGVRLVRGFRLPIRVGLIAGLVLAAGALQAGVDTAMGQNLQRVFPTAQPLADARDYYGGMLTLYVEIYALCATALALIESTQQGRRQERLLAEARAAAQQAQLAALRFQLNPHFLFNALNAISSLIVTGRNAEADEMLCKLSNFLRFPLAVGPDETAPLAEELSALETYLDIEAVRFGERLAVAIDCPPELSDALVPGFLLQPLVENAVKYAVAPARRPVSVRVEARREGEELVLSVVDDGDAAAAAGVPSGAGVGLANVRQRLQVLHGPRGVLETTRTEHGFTATVRLPLRHAAAPARRSPARAA